jgi:hypothetical protein
MSNETTLSSNNLSFKTSGVEDVILTRTANAHATFSSDSIPGTVRLSGLTNPTDLQDAATKDYVDKSNVTQYELVVQKNPLPGQFSTIEAALGSITDSSLSKPYLVSVGPGIYVENQLVVPTYVSVKGSSINPTVVRNAIPNQHLFVMSEVTELSFMTLEGTEGSVSPGAGAGYAAVYAEDVGDFAQLHKISIYGFDVGVKNKSIANDSIIYTEYVDVNGDYTYGIYNDSGTSSSMAFTSLENTFTFESANVGTKYAVLNNGATASMEITACNFTGAPSMSGVVMTNGGTVTIDAATFQNFDNNAIWSQNTGSGVNLKINAPSFIDCTLDFSIDNVGTTGYFFGNSPRDNYFIAEGSDFFIAGVDNNVVNVSEKGGDFTSIKDAVDSITDSSITNIYIVKIGPGIYIEDPIVLKQGIFLVGSFLNGTTLVPTSPSNRILTTVDGSYVRDLYFTGATDGGTAVYFQGTNGIGSLVRDCSFGDNYTQVEVFGTTASTTIVVDRCAILGSCHTVIKATNTGTVLTRLTASNIFYRRLVPTMCTYFLRAEGQNVQVNVSASRIR